MIDRAFRSAKQLAADIRAKRVGSLELLEAYVARVEKYNPALNATAVSELGRRSRAERCRNSSLRDVRGFAYLRAASFAH